MKLFDFLVGFGAGLIVYHLSNKRVGVVNPEALAVETKAVALGQVLNETVNSYGDALRQDYDIVMPSDQISKKVKARARQLTNGRYSMDLEKQQAPTSI
jgi:hypothetical protein